MSEHDPADTVLVARVLLQDDRHAYNTLVRRYQSSLRLWLARLCHGDQASADDLAQETFLQAWRRLDQFRGDAKFGTWLHSIGYRQFLMRERRLQGERRGGIDERAELEQVLDPRVAVEYQHALSHDLQRAMAGLSTQEYAAIVQCCVFEHSQEEAAAVMGCAVGTIKSHVFRGKQKLKQALAGWRIEESS